MENKVCPGGNFSRDLFNLARKPDIVLIRKKDNVARAGVQSVFKVFDNALAAALDIFNPFILRLTVQNDFTGLALRIIVRNNYFVVFAELREDGINLFGNILLAFIGGKCNGYFHN